MVNQDKLALFEFAYCDSFNKKIRDLSKVAEPEDWYFETSTGTYDQMNYAGLRQYIHYIFAKHKTENKIVIVDDYAVINTGLLTINGEDIYMVFIENTTFEKSMCKYSLVNFLKESDRGMPNKLRLNGVLPNPIDFFFDCPELSYFDTKLEIVMDVDHIYDDNLARLPLIMQSLDRNTALTLLEGAKIKSIKRIKRNNRLVVPQVYFGNIQYLMPFEINEIIVPIVLEKQDNCYRANTILTLEMAYSNARLLMKPESSWLAKDKK